VRQMTFLRMLLLVAFITIAFTILCGVLKCCLCPERRSHRSRKEARRNHNRLNSSAVNTPPESPSPVRNASRRQPSFNSEPYFQPSAPHSMAVLAPPSYAAAPSYFDPPTAPPLTPAVPHRIVPLYDDPPPPYPGLA